MPDLRTRRRSVRPPATLLLVLALFMVVPAPPGGSGVAAARSRESRAEALHQEALALMRRNTIDSRRQAIVKLEEATAIAPGVAEYELTLGRTYYQAGYLRQARLRFAKVMSFAPQDAEARYGLGQVWRRDWLKYLERSSLYQATQHLKAAVRLNPAHCDAWLMLVPLLVEQGGLDAAAAAAWQAHLADPKRPEALVAYGYTAYRLGQVERADSAFTAAVPRLPRAARDRFLDIAPVASERDTILLNRLSLAGQSEFVRGFWKEHDPDIGTPENEALLEYWSRVTHAYFLYYNPKRGEWDERGELYVRYGAPAHADYNPVNAPLYVTSPLGRVMPANVLTWEYPHIGLRVVMQDRLLSEYYMLPINPWMSMDPVPDPAILAELPDAIATRGGRGVFPSLPPGVRSRPASGAIARFEGEGGPRLIASIEAPAAPDDSLWADYVVLDTTGKEVARQRRTLVPSACDPAEAQVADFEARYPPGEYLVGMTVRDREGRRGLYRHRIAIRPQEAGLALSDVAISCGLPFEAGAGDLTPVVRPEPNPEATVRGSEPVTAYFEIYRLETNREGRARFEYVYTVRSAERDRRIWIQRLFQPRPQPAPISASREEEQAGNMRRQFVRVPLQSLPSGRYYLEITVRDLLAGTEAQGWAEFTYLAEPLPDE